MIQMTLIGTAAAAPLSDRALSCAALTCQGRTLLFDCGDGTQSALRKARVSMMSIDVICLTHFHGDHIFGLPGLLQSMALHSRTRPVTLVVPHEDDPCLPALMTLSLPLTFDVSVVTLPPEGLPLRSLIPDARADAVLSPIATQHRVPSAGYRFTLSHAGRFLPERARALGVPQKLWGRLQHGECVTVDGRAIAPADVLSEPRQPLRIIYTGDTRPCEAVLEAARDADLLIMEATYGEDAHEAQAVKYGHSTFSATARLAAEAGAKRLWLTHYSGMIADPQAHLPNAQAHFPQVVCGYDGLTATLSFRD